MFPSITSGNLTSAISDRPSQFLRASNVLHNPYGGLKFNMTTLQLILIKHYA